MQKYIILGHENPDVDSIVSGYIYQNYLNRHGVNAEFIIPDKTIEEDTLRICRDFNLEPTIFQKELVFDENTKFILLDHHQRDNIGEIVQIIDHHPSSNCIDDFKTINEYASSTSCLIVQGFEQYFSIMEIELACLAAMVDTASFSSTKTREIDIDWVRQMCEEKNLDYNKLYEAGLGIDDLSNPKEIMLHGLKKYTINNHKVESSTIHISNIKNNWKKISQITMLLNEYLLENNLDLFIFIIHDMDNQDTWVYKIDATGFKRKKYDEYTSRGSTIIPDLEIELQDKPKQKIKTSEEN